jgi:lipopolysaccharide transport system ATP-binding protein
MPALIVQNLSKEYVLGGRRRPQETFRGMLADALLSPLRRYRRLSGNADGGERFTALKDVSFSVDPGEVLGIIGKNGAGKTTLLKILSGITEPTDGRVELKGRTSSLLEVGTGFHPELTGRENVFLNGAILGMSKDEIRNKFDAIVEFAEVDKFIDTPVKHYSSGMYVRLAFAVAAHLEPEILFVDEVLAVGDAQFQKKCLGRMDEIGKEGRTILVVSHNMQVIQSLCSRAIWLDGGRIAYDGNAVSAVVAYTQSHSRTVSEREWPEDDASAGNESVRLLSARVVPEHGNPGDPLTVATPFRMEFTYCLLAPRSNFFVGMHFRSLDGGIVFRSASPPVEAQGGVHRSFCRVPGNLLNNGRFTLDLYFMRDGSALLFRKEAPLVFEIFDTEKEPGQFMGDVPGVVRPDLQWHTESEKAQ